MDAKSVLKKELANIKPSEKELKEIKEKTSKLINELDSKLKKRKIIADIFIGGSLAKGTIIKKDKYDIDIFVRFDKKYKDEQISELLAGVLKDARKVHGSRDYFQIVDKETIFEIIPVIKIAKPSEARNVTDLSYFHVSYIKSKINKNKKLADEIMLAKSFAHAQGCYGAESYIKGFSGYALELLISYYGSFLNFIKKIKDKKKIIIDPEKFYKNQQHLLLDLNEAKLQSPIVYVDPTFKERNALAALSEECFEKLKKRALEFLKKPSSRFFENKDLEEALKKRYKSLKIIETRTEKQKGDIAGSKLKKFYEFLAFKLSKDFELIFKEFEYNEDENTGKNYFVLKQKKEIIINGPPIISKENLEKFKEKHKNLFIKQGKAYAKEKSRNLNELIDSLKKDKSMKEMGITEIRLI